MMTQMTELNRDEYKNGDIAARVYDITNGVDSIAGCITKQHFHRQINNVARTISDWSSTSTDGKGITNIRNRGATGTEI